MTARLASRPSRLRCRPRSTGTSQRQCHHLRGIATRVGERHRSSLCCDWTLDGQPATLQHQDDADGDRYARRSSGPSTRLSLRAALSASWSLLGERDLAAAATPTSGRPFSSRTAHRVCVAAAPGTDWGDDHPSRQAPLGRRSTHRGYSGRCQLHRQHVGRVTHAVSKANQTITFTSSAPAAAVVGGTDIHRHRHGHLRPHGDVHQLDVACAPRRPNGPRSTSSRSAPAPSRANQAGNANFNAAPQVTQSFVVGKGSQTITFTSTAPAAAAYNGTAYTATATGGASGNPVTFSTLTPSVCTSSGTNGATIGFVGVGSCTVAADQAGNANYSAATQATPDLRRGQGQPDDRVRPQPPAGQDVRRCRFQRRRVRECELSARGQLLAAVRSPDARSVRRAWCISLRPRATVWSSRPKPVTRSTTPRPTSSRPSTSRRPPRPSPSPRPRRSARSSAARPTPRSPRPRPA